MTHKPGWAVDRVIIWFYDQFDLTPADEDFAHNRDVCSAAPDIVSGYWLVICTDTGGEYLVDDVYGNVSPENAAAEKLVPTLTSAEAIHLAWEWMKSDDAYYPYNSANVGSPSTCQPVSWDAGTWRVACPVTFGRFGMGTWLTMCVFEATLIVTGCTEGVD